MNLIDDLTLNQCDCAARSILLTETTDGWRATCWSCGRTASGATMDEAMQNWRDTRDMEKIKELRKQYQ